MAFYLEFLEPFLEKQRRLPKTVKKAAEKTLYLLSQNPKHPSLNTHKVEDATGGHGGPVFEAYVTMKYRLTWEYGPKQNMITLRNIDNHDECLKKP